MKKTALGQTILLLCLCALPALRVSAFSLLGPYEPWMNASNTFHQYNDIGGETIGGPMDLTNEYRWNVPVVTYGFDQSFLDYFGSNGVAAVQDAIQILNDLPPADQIVSSNYPFDSRQINFTAQAENLQDLKSTTLALLLEHLGLASPTRNIAVLRQWKPLFLTNADEPSWPPGTFPTNLLARNFDPETLLPTHTVNDTQYQLTILSMIVVPFPTDPLADTFTAVGDAETPAGAFYTGLTYDDAGGLRYLLSTNNLNFEPMLSGVHGRGPNATSWQTNALRPGVGKLTWMPQPAGSPLVGYLPLTNQFVDTWLSNGVPVQQQLERVIAEPDFIFSAETLGSGSGPGPLFRRTGTTNWLNCSTNPGPGIIAPGIKIVFNQTGNQFVSDITTSENSLRSSALWASFDDSTNEPVVFPAAAAGTGQLNITMWLSQSGSASFQHMFQWSQNTGPGQAFVFETSTDLVNWTWLLLLNEDGIDCTYWNQLSADEHRFYRLVPAP